MSVCHPPGYPLVSVGINLGESYAYSDDILKLEGTAAIIVSTDHSISFSGRCD